MNSVPTTPSPEFKTNIERPLPTSWAAAPLDIYANEEVRNTQAEVFATIVARAEQACILLDLPKKLSDYLVASALQRHTHETQLNYINYSKKPVVESQIPSELHGAYQHAMKGDALPGELLDIGEILDMPVELCSLSHIGGIEISKLATMRQAVEATIQERGGTLYDMGDPKNTELGIILVDAMLLHGSVEEINFISMLRKRYIGELPDGRVIIEKSQFEVRTDQASGLNAKMAARIRKIPIKNNVNALNEIAAIPGFAETVYEALALDAVTVAIPMNTAIYARPVLDGGVVEPKEGSLSDKSVKRIVKVGRTTNQSASGYGSK